MDYEVTVVCSVCGKRFFAKSKKAMYCSDRCRLKSQRVSKKSNVKLDVYHPPMRAMAAGYIDSEHPFSAGPRAVDSIISAAAQVRRRG